MRRILSFLIIVLAQMALCAESRAQEQASSCPSITVTSKVYNPMSGIILNGACPGSPISFTAAVTGVDPKQNYTFHWTVSAGEIVEGQGTSSIRVSTDKAIGARVTATVELVGLSGLKPECSKTAEGSVGVAICCLPPCPTISIQCPTDLPQTGAPMTVSVNVSGGDPNAEVRYKWAVSAGTITAGQGTHMITVDTTSLGGNNVVTATVEIDGFPPECDRTESCTVGWEIYLPPSRKFDAYGDLGRADEDERMAQFAEALRQEPGAQGYIFYYGPRGVYQRLGRALEFLKSQPGIDPSRITAVKVSGSEKFEVELWIRPTGAPVPQPEPHH
jgi:hypothetical protein